jgi:hypothetical protein
VQLREGIGETIDYFDALLAQGETWKAERVGVL